MDSIDKILAESRKCAIKILDDCYYPTSEKYGRSSAKKALYKVLFNIDSDEDYNYISNIKHGREAVKCFSDYDIYHILSKYLYHKALEKNNNKIILLFSDINKVYEYLLMNKEKVFNDFFDDRYHLNKALDYNDISKYSDEKIISAFNNIDNFYQDKKIKDPNYNILKMYSYGGKNE